MSKKRWISTLKAVLIILALIAAAFLFTHTDEAGAWVSENLMHQTNSNLQQILQ